MALDTGWADIESLDLVVGNGSESRVEGIPKRGGRGEGREHGGSMFAPYVKKKTRIIQGRLQALVLQ